MSISCVVIATSDDFFWRHHGLQLKLLLVTSLSLGAFFFNRTLIIIKKCSQVPIAMQCLKNTIRAEVRIVQFPQKFMHVAGK